MSQSTPQEIPLDYGGLHQYRIDRSGLVRTPKGKVLQPLTMAHAAKDITTKEVIVFGRAPGEPPRLIQVETRPPMAAVIRITQAQRDFAEAWETWCKEVPKEHRHRWKLGSKKPNLTEFVPDDEILEGDPEIGWVRLELPAHEFWYFHGPSTAARLFRAADLASSDNSSTEIR